MCQQIVCYLQSFAYRMVVLLKSNWRRWRSSLERSFLAIGDFFVVPLLIFNGNLLEWGLLVFAETTPSVTHSLHDLSYCQEGEALPNNLPELLTKVYVCGERLLRLSLRLLLLLWLLLIWEVHGNFSRRTFLLDPWMLISKFHPLRWLSSTSFCLVKVLQFDHSVTLLR